MSKLTQRAIVSSFLGLVSTKPLDKVTVKDIVEDCGITRNTFYYYFRDIYEIVDGLLENEFKFSYRHGVSGTWEDSFRVGMAFAISHRKAIFNMYNSSKRDELMLCLRRALREFSDSLVEENSRDINVSDTDKKLVSSFYQGALMRFIVDWLDNGMRESADVIIHRVAVLFGDSMRAALKRASDNPMN